MSDSIRAQVNLKNGDFVEACHLPMVPAVGSVIGLKAGSFEVLAITMMATETNGPPFYLLVKPLPEEEIVELKGGPIRVRFLDMNMEDVKRRQS